METTYYQLQFDSWKFLSLMIGLIIAVFQLLWYVVFTGGSYKTNVTDNQIVYWQRSLPYIQQFTGKRCTSASLMAEQRFCTERCQTMFYYIPSAPYKNYRFYNYTSKDCEPKVICPKIFTVFYNSTTNKCTDMSTGDNVPGVNATPYAGNDTYEVEFDCINGYVGIYKGRQECICDFGWKTTFMPGTRQNPKYQKCNKAISIYEYFPSSVQIYYDPLLDLPYPHPADPDYWILILILYLRQFKYSIQSLIWPPEIQLTLLAIPTQSLITTDDYVYLIWGGLLIGIILFVSLYEKLKNTRTMSEVVLEEKNQPNVN